MTDAGQGCAIDAQRPIVIAADVVRDPTSSTEAT